MFHLGVIDHVRLNFDRAVQNYTVHARAAEQLATLTYRIRLGMVAIAGLAAAATVVALMRGGRGYQIAAVVMASIAFVSVSIYVGSDLEGRVAAHRAFAHRLWLVCERYRELVAEMNDKVLDRDTLLQRCDKLAVELHAVYEHPFSATQRGFEAMRQAGVDKEETPQALAS
jgi:hypothetical protein